MSILCLGLCLEVYLGASLRLKVILGKFGEFFIGDSYELGFILNLIKTQVMEKKSTSDS